MFLFSDLMSATCSTEFWDALAPLHAAIEDNYLDRRSIRRIARQIRSPVLVVGAGQGLIVAELHRQGFECDGVDWSSEMIRYARSRRGLNLVQADARALPFREGTYATILYATGVIDFMSDEEQIRLMLNEGRRVLKRPGSIFVAFYRASPALENFLQKVGLVSNHTLAHRRSLELYLLNPAQMFRWVAQQTGGYFRAMTSLLRMYTFSTLKEKAMGPRVQSIFRKLGRQAHAVIAAAPETQPYRNEVELRNLFKRLEIPVKRFEATASCYIVEI